MQIGDVHIHPIADGTFRASPRYFGDHVTARGHEDLFSRHGKAWLPIGCFLVRTRSRNVLVDAGEGPEMRDDGPRRLLVGGQLMVGLHAIGVAPADIDDVICTHLHSDHCGWLFDVEGRPVFPKAGIWFGAPDWHHFVLNREFFMFDHIRYGLTSSSADRLHLVSRDVTVTAGVDLLMTPGHTPGHLAVVVSSQGKRALLLGDAITCPAQLDEPSWQALGDVDPGLAASVRDRLFRELEDPNSLAAGAHFPELRFGRVVVGRARRWTSG
jgi:glyoxylase-like metal-dependent hydrolase (beta-lactamase superfamily II)